jgi:hypothetical protein
MRTEAQHLSALWGRAKQKRLDKLSIKVCVCVCVCVCISVCQGA